MPVFILDSNNQISSNIDGKFGRIGYDNVFLRGVTFTADDDSSSNPIGDLPAVNIKYPINGTIWMPYRDSSAYATYTVDTEDVNTPVNYFAFYEQNLFESGSTIELRYSDNGVDWTTMIGPVAPTTSKPSYYAFTTIETHRYWQVRVQCESLDLYLGVVLFGVEIQLERPVESPFVRPEHTFKPDVWNVQSENGKPLGNVLLETSGFTSIALKEVTPIYVDTIWMPFVKSAVKYPFFWAWMPEDYPSEVAYCFVNKGTSVNPPRYTNSLYMSVNLGVRCFTE